jgi:hypothetical protein
MKLQMPHVSLIINLFRAFPLRIADDVSRVRGYALLFLRERERESERKNKPSKFKKSFSFLNLIAKSTSVQYVYSKKGGRVLDNLCTSFH